MENYLKIVEMEIENLCKKPETVPYVSSSSCGISTITTSSQPYKDYFNEILEDMKSVHERKNADYGNNFHKRYKRWGFLTALLRLSDKMERLENIYERGEIQVKDESVEDTLLDLANYAVMTIVELKNEKNGRV